MQTALLGLSIAAEAGTVVAIYLVARRLYGEWAGVASATLLLFQPPLLDVRRDCSDVQP